MAKATPIPSSVNFPKYHQSCDHCGNPASWHAGQANRTSRETVLGSFSYQVCFACTEQIEAMEHDNREAAYKRAMVRHAMCYSVAYGEFVAKWLGVSARGFRFPQVAA